MVLRSTGFFDQHRAPCPACREWSATARHCCCWLTDLAAALISACLHGGRTCLADACLCFRQQFYSTAHAFSKLLIVSSVDQWDQRLRGCRTQTLWNIQLSGSAICQEMRSQHSNHGAYQTAWLRCLLYTFTCRFLFLGILVRPYLFLRISSHGATFLRKANHVSMCCGLSHQILQGRGPCPYSDHSQIW